MATAPWQSKLIPYEKEIFRMWYKERATLKAIQTFLNAQKITASLPTISRFIKRRNQRPDPHAIATTTVRQPEPPNTQTALDRVDELITKYARSIKKRTVLS